MPNHATHVAATAQSWVNTARAAKAPGGPSGEDEQCAHRQKGNRVRALGRVLDPLGHTTGILPPHVCTGAVIKVTSERMVFDVVGLGWREPRER